MKRISSGLLTGLLALLLFIPAVCRADQVKVPEAGAGTEDDVVIHTVVKDDTLWDLSEKYLEDPFKWPRIWKVNPYIKNPHLIYPGDVVRITPDGIEILRRKGVDVGKLPVQALEPEPATVVTLEPEVVPPPPPAKPRLVSEALARKGFITDKELKAAGAIIQAKEKVILIEEGEEVFVSFRDRSAVKVGDRYSVFLTSERIKHPVTGERLGHMTDILGDLVITGTGKVIEARVQNSFKEIEAGAKLTPYKEPSTEVEITEPADGVSGYVVAALEGYRNTSSGDIIYIDRGTRDGVVKGNVMRIFRDRKQAQDPLRTKTKVKLPPIDLGTLVVVEPRESTSACMVLTSVKAVMAGDKVSTLQAE